MKIISVDKYKGETYCIEFEGHENVYLNREIVSQYSLKAGLTLPESVLTEIVNANDFRKAKERAMYLLDGKDYTFSELYKKLLSNYPEETCLEVCKTLASYGFINDMRYAENKARVLFEVKRFGMYRAKLELKRCGLSDDIISAVTQKYSDKDDVLERLEELVEKKYERYLVDEKGVNKVKAALQRQGYSYSDIKAVLDLYEFDF